MPMPPQQFHEARPDDEADLIRRAVLGEERAVRILIQRHNRRLYRLARSIVRDDAEAEDALQEAYVRAFANLAAFRGGSGLGTWLSRIVINEALGRLRRRRPTVDWTVIEERQAGAGVIIPFPSTHAQTDPERTMAQREIRSMLEQAIDDLPDAFRTVLVARVIEEMSTEETADLLQIRPETVKTRLHRARRLLRQAVEKHIGAALTDAFPFAGRRCEQVADAVIRRLNSAS
jgi:RNA polymerase sigma-70 factor (ECF subfamily)